jgi:hypothetical protein
VPVRRKKFWLVFMALASCFRRAATKRFLPIAEHNLVSR